MDLHQPAVKGTGMLYDYLIEAGVVSRKERVIS